MKVIAYNKETGNITDVELTTSELVAQAHFDRYLDKGHGIPLAAQLALNRAYHETGVFPSHSFIAWLSDDTCRAIGWRVHMLPKWRDLLEQERRDAREARRRS